jgi:hypothetical protein
MICCDKSKIRENYSSTVVDRVSRALGEFSSSNIAMVAADSNDTRTDLKRVSVSFSKQRWSNMDWNLSDRIWSHMIALDVFPPHPRKASVSEVSHNYFCEKSENRI